MYRNWIRAITSSPIWILDFFWLIYIGHVIRFSPLDMVIIYITHKLLAKVLFDLFYFWYCWYSISILHGQRSCHLLYIRSMIITKISQLHFCGQRCIIMYYCVGWFEIVNWSSILFLKCQFVFFGLVFFLGFLAKH